MVARPGTVTKELEQLPHGSLSALFFRRKAIVREQQPSERN
jgi:hypothetical protein